MFFWTKEAGLRPDIVKTWKYILSLPIIFESYLRREKLGQIQIVYDNIKKLYSIFEPVWVSVSVLL